MTGASVPASARERSAVSTPGGAEAEPPDMTGDSVHASARERPAISKPGDAKSEPEPEPPKIALDSVRSSAPPGGASPAPRGGNRSGGGAFTYWNTA